MSTATMGSTSVLSRTEEATSTGDPIMAHIVDRKGPKSGGDLLMEARINGTAVEALCGHVFVPQRDPRNHENCAECLRLFKEYTGKDDGWTDS